MFQAAEADAIKLNDLANGGFTAVTVSLPFI